MKFQSLYSFPTGPTVTLAIFLIILTTCNGKKVRVHSSVLLSACEQRDEFIKSKKIQPPIKSEPNSHNINCVWFRIPTCRTSDSSCRRFRKCKGKKGRGVNLISEKRPKVAQEPIVCPAPTPPCPKCSGREWAEKIEAPLADDED